MRLNIFTNFTVVKRLGIPGKNDLFIIYSIRRWLNFSYKRRKLLAVTAVWDSFRKKNSTARAQAALSSALSPVFRKSSRYWPVRTIWMGWVLGEVRDVEIYNRSGDVFNGKCSLLAGYGINSKSFDHSVFNFGWLVRFWIFHNEHIQNIKDQRTANMWRYATC